MSYSELFSSINCQRIVFFEDDFKQIAFDKNRMLYDMTRMDVEDRQLFLSEIKAQSPELERIIRGFLESFDSVFDGIGVWRDSVVYGDITSAFPLVDKQSPEHRAELERLYATIKDEAIAPLYGIGAKYGIGVSQPTQYDSIFSDYILYENRAKSYRVYTDFSASTAKLFLIDISESENAKSVVCIIDNQLGDAKRASEIIQAIKGASSPERKNIVGCVFSSQALFEEISKDDGSSIYILATENSYKCVDFNNNIFYEVLLENTNAGTPQFRADSFIERMQKLRNDLSERFNDIRGLLGQFADLVESLGAKLDHRNAQLADEISDLDDCIKYLESKPNLTFAENVLLKAYKARFVKLFSEATLNTKILSWVQKLDAAGIRVGRIGGSLFAAVDLFMVCGDMTEDLDNVISVYGSIPNPCKEDSEKAESLRRAVVAMGIGAGVYYVSQIISDAVQITLAITGTAAALPTGGTSLSAVGIALGLAAANIATNVVYSLTFDKTLNGLENQINALKCNKENPDLKGEPYPGPDMTFCIDPSGFVYEGVPSNRLEGVTATCYYKETVEDMYGDTHEEVVLWDAENYGQQNPLLTDANGYYRWDVPIGMWQVKYEKEGYETTYSDWLPVPPPQLDVNIGMVQMRQPEVIKARAYPAAVEFEFDKFMFPEDLTLDNIKVTDEWGYDLYGEIELLNAEVDDPNAITSIRRAPGTGLTLASKVRFNAYDYFYSDEVTLKVSKRVKSYAGLEMAENYVVTLPIEYEMEKIDVDTTLTMPYGDSRQLTVTVLPARASKGKTLSVRTMSPMILSTDAETYTLDNNGQAIITVHGDLPGAGSLLYSIEDYDLTASTLVKVMMESQMTVATPTASIASGSEVEKGTAVYLRCATEGATIYYTLDGSCPCDNTAARKVYDGSPIIINSTVTIKAMATAPDLYDSDVITFVYRVAGGKKGDVNGDGEVNIADVNAVIDIILGGQADADTRYRADVNGDGEVNIADINAVIDIILNPATNMMLNVNCDDLLHMDDVTMKPGDVRTLQVTVDHAAQYSALQCDIVLPAGLTLMDVYAPGANTVKTGGINDNTCRALNYSMARLPFVGDTQPVMTFTVRADAALAPESEVTLTNVVLADAGNKAWRVSDCTARVNNASGINDMTATVDCVWVEGRTLFIESRQDGTAQLAMINGMVSNIPLKAGINRQRLDCGIYIVVINGQSHKIAIK